MKTKLLLLILILISTAKINNAQGYFPSGTLKQSTNSACNNPITMEYGVSAFYFSIGDPITFVIDFGDGTSYTAPIQYISNTPYDSLLGTVTHTYVNAGTYTPSMTVSGPGATPLLVNWWWGPNTLTVGPPAPCGNVSGSVYNDINSNCIMDVGEEMNYQNISVSLAGNVIATGTSDNTGSYSIDYPFLAGQTYVVTYIPNANPVTCVGVSCPNTLTYAVNTLNSTNNNFGLSMTNTNYDMASCWISCGGSGILNAGFNRTFYFGFSNIYCPILGGTYTVTLDPSVNYLSANPAPSTVVGNTLTWNINSIPIWDIVEVNTYVPLMNVNNVPFMIGDPICHTSTITGAITGDVNLLNNTRNDCFYIGTSYDPNDKHVEPKGEGATANVPFGTEFDYKIRFQNTGNSPAINVVVMDTLDADLDETTVVVDEHSHHMIYSRIGNVLKFELTNIMLPDSTTDYEKSQGGLSFKVKHKAGLPMLTPITNKAAIYFDVNAPIITNTTLNTLGLIQGVNEQNSEVDLQVYPNPAREALYVKTGNSAIQSATIYNALGVKVREVQSDKEITSISLSHLPKGVYFILVKDISDKIYSRHFIKE